MERPGRAFYFKLALALGTTVRELLKRIDSAEITEWMAYFKLAENPNLTRPKQSPEDIKTLLSSLTIEGKK